MIAVDIDGVVADTEPILVKCLEEFTGEKFSPPSQRTFDFKEGFTNLSTNDCLYVIDSTIISAGNDIPVIDFDATYYALAVIQKTFGMVNFVTSRGENTREVTESWIFHHFGKLNFKLYLSNDKESVMNNYGMNAIVEDRLKTVNSIRDKSKHRAFLINREYNMGRDVCHNVTRVDGLIDVINIMNLK